MELHALSAVELSTRLAAGEISSVEVVRALIDRAREVDPKVRAFVHRFDAEALRQAEEADLARKRGDALGPLHGLPMSVKESIATAGLPVTLGVKRRQGTAQERDAVIVRALKEAGAIVLGKTNVPQFLLFHEADNPIWGRTANPFDLGRVPGGSSGGEAAALAAGLTPLGIGTDIGGSIRVPCGFAGVAGLKPTVDRWSNLDSFTALVGQEIVRGQCGPMARTSGDVALMWRAIDPARLARHDPAVPPLPAGDPLLVDVSKLTIGWYDEDGVLAPSASVRRAVKTAVELLEKRGAKVVPFAPPHAQEIIDTYFAGLSSDGGVTLDRQLGDDPLVPQLKQLRQIAGLSGPARAAASVVMGMKGEARVKRLLDLVHEKPVAELWRIAARRSELRRRVFEAWNAAGADCVVCPVHATPALRHGDSGDFTLAGSFSMRYNFLNFPAGVAPVTRVLEEDARRGSASDRLERKATLVDEGSVGLPLGVQVVARPYREDLVLAAMIAIEDGARERKDFPKTPVDPR